MVTPADAFACAPPSRQRQSQAASRRRALDRGGAARVAAYDVNDDRLTLWSSTQLAHEVRAFLMKMLRLDEKPASRRSAGRRRRLSAPNS